MYLSTDVLESWWKKSGLDELVVLYSTSSIYDEWINDEKKRAYQGMRVKTTQAACGIVRYTDGVQIFEGYIDESDPNIAPVKDGLSRTIVADGTTYIKLRKNGELLG